MATDYGPAGRLPVLVQYKYYCTSSRVGLSVRQCGSSFLFLQFDLMCSFEWQGSFGRSEFQSRNVMCVVVGRILLSDKICQSCSVKTSCRCSQFPLSPFVDVAYEYMILFFCEVRVHAHSMLMPSHQSLYMRFKRSFILCSYAYYKKILYLLYLGSVTVFVCIFCCQRIRSSRDG